ncbi:hypothetical protein [Actinoplanes sp. NPDC020271]|uniref:hypothetical protein n=1 Tax=Actinoplanes sp. NPDC020271 TaxID=3363896 RepID=UPI0037AD0AD5
MTTNPNNNRSTYFYFVAFQYFQGTGLGFANMEVPLSGPIRSLTDVRTVERMLRERDYTRALVTGFSLLRQEQRSDQPQGQR